MSNHHPNEHKHNGGDFKIEDDQINDKYSHTVPVYSKVELFDFYQDVNIDLRSLHKLKHTINRYAFENNWEPICSTMQGVIYNAIDITTGRRVVVKAGQKYLVDKNLSKYGATLHENMKDEATMLEKISNIQGCDPGM